MKRNKFFPNLLPLMLAGLSMLFTACPKAAAPSQANPHKSAPKDVLKSLLQGNETFLKGLEAKDQHYESFLKNQNGQHPQAVVVTCSDSRIPPSLLFDKDLGDLFTIRTAGNIVGDIELASIEYAVLNLDVRLILVMGHTHCGAIKAFVKHEEAPEHIKILMDTLTKETEIQDLAKRNLCEDMHEVTVANVRHTAKSIPERSKVIGELVDAGKLEVQAAIYELESGRVRLLD